MTSPLLLFGGSGMLGSAISQHLASDYAIVRPTRASIDIRDPDAVKRLIDDVEPSIVVNCAAMTDVDGCESAPERAFATNAKGPRVLAEVCDGRRITLAHFSTDYIFDGELSCYTETESPRPLSVYGASKLAGERGIIDATSAYLIMRTAWLYGPNGTHFVGAISNAAAQRPELRVVDDQIGNPTSTAEVCSQLRVLLRNNATGIFNTVCAGACTRFELAQAIVDYLGHTCTISPCSSREFPRPAPRPACSILCNNKFERLTGYAPTPWRTALHHYLEQTR